MIGGLHCGSLENLTVFQAICILSWVSLNKGIRDAGSTAEFKILFEILKFKNLEIRKFENLKIFGTFGKFRKKIKIWKISIFLKILKI